MLLRMETLRGIADGTITLAFRRWKKPTVRAGGSLRTAVGELAIDAVEVVPLKSLSAADAHAAGFATLAQLKAELRGRDGALHKVTLRYVGEDRRVALRGRADLSGEELAALASQLTAMDRRSRSGPWTRQVLVSIQASPGRRAADLAHEVGLERLPFKQRVRHLKELGLTESLEVGYRLSPRGASLLTFLQEG